MHGLRVHLSGSADKECSGVLLDVAHRFVQSLARKIISRGGGLVFGVGAEPRAESGRPCIFDWSVLEAVAASPSSHSDWPALRSGRFAAVGSQRGLEKVPSDRANIWTSCCGRTDVQVLTTPPGWRMAGIIRERQVMVGDILVAIGGGAGVEHLADRYRDEGKPVIPIYSELGAFSQDGNGGSRFLHERALADPDTFFRLREGAGNATARLSSLRLQEDSDCEDLAEELVRLLVDLRPPSAFYVRLLATDHTDFPAVEHFFRSVVDPVVAERGFTPREMGREQPERAFMNVELFEALHRAGIVIVDLTGIRPNCILELGYALARRRRVILSARRGTKLPFDGDKLPTHFWESDVDDADRSRFYGDWFDRYSELPPLVE